MDEVYVDLHLLTELVLLMAMDVPGVAEPERRARTRDLKAQLRERLEAQKKEIEHGPPPSP